MVEQEGMDEIEGAIRDGCFMAMVLNNPVCACSVYDAITGVFIFS